VTTLTKTRFMYLLLIAVLFAFMLAFFHGHPPTHGMSDGGGL
jgi:hypothetical protein